MRYRRELSTLVLPRIPASLEAVLRVLSDGLTGRYPVPADLPTPYNSPTDEISEMAGTQPELGRRLGERNELFAVQRPPGPL